MSTLSMPKQITGLVASLAICYTVSFVGAMASINARSFYSQLALPTWAPPGWLFGPVWLILYTMMAVSAWLVWRTDNDKAKRRALFIFLVQLFPNALWSWLFFYWKSGAASFANIVFLWLLIILTIIAFWKVKPLSGVLLVPYLLWVSFAATLNLVIWRMNTGVF